MYKHLFKLIWNKKKQNFLFLSEILISFLVIFIVFSFVVFYYQNYKQPMGFKYDKVWRISYNNSQKTKSSDTLTLFYEGLKRSLQAMPQVKEVSYSGGNVPFADSHSTTNIKTKDKEFDRVNNYNVDISHKQVFQMQLLEGKWLGKADRTDKGAIPVVINKRLKEKMYGAKSPVGKNLWYGEDDKKNTREVIGVVADMKYDGDYYGGADGMYSKIDTSFYRWVGTISLRVSDDADAAFESKLYKMVANTMKDSNIEITHYAQMRESKNAITIIPLIILMIIAGFLIFNVALGLFGVLWYSISKRRGEIGLRMAIGASGKSISSQLILESMFMATLALIVGCFFAVQFPLLKVYDVQASVYLYAIVLSVLFIYLIVFLCSLYPGKQAAAIMPAVALHEE
jgi:putative ABC transport system permease protein